MLMTRKNEALEVHKEFGRQEKCPAQGRTKNKRGLFLSAWALAKFAGLGCFVLHVGQEDRDAGGGVNR